MADWTSIDPNALLPGAPWTSPLAQAAFENPEAIAEGAASAPRIFLGSLERIAAGTAIRYEKLAAQNKTGDTDFETAAEFPMLQGGSIRVTLDHEGVSGGNSQVRVVRKRADSETVLVTWATTGSASRSLDVTVIPCDFVYVEHRVTIFGVAETSRISNIRLRTNGEDYIGTGDAMGHVVNNRALT